MRILTVTQKYVVLEKMALTTEIGIQEKGQELARTWGRLVS